MKDCFVIFLDYYFANTCLWFPNTLIQIRYFHTNTYALYRVICLTTCELLFIITYFAISTHTSLPHQQDRERGFAWRSVTDGGQPIVYTVRTDDHTYVTMGISSPSKFQFGPLGDTSLQCNPSFTVNLIRTSDMIYTYSFPFIW